MEVNMKTTLFSVLFLLMTVVTVGCSDKHKCEELRLFRYLSGGKYYFEVCPNRVVIQVDEKATENDIENAFRENSSLQNFEISKMGNREFRMVHFRNSCRCEITQLINQWECNDIVLHVGYVIIDETGRETAALTNQINVRLKDENDFPILQQALVPYDIDKIEQAQFDSLSYLLVVSCFSAKSALQIANELHETGLFHFASPNLLLFIRFGN